MKTHYFALSCFPLAAVINFTLAEPEKYGIADLEATFGEYGIQNLTEKLHDMRSYLDNLRNFNMAYCRR